MSEVLITPEHTTRMKVSDVLYFAFPYIDTEDKPDNTLERSLFALTELYNANPGRLLLRGSTVRNYLHPPTNPFYWKISGLLRQIAEHKDLYLGSIPSLAVGPRDIDIVVLDHQSKPAVFPPTFQLDPRSQREEYIDTQGQLVTPDMIVATYCVINRPKSHIPQMIVHVQTLHCDEEGTPIPSPDHLRGFGTCSLTRDQDSLAVLSLEGDELVAHIPDIPPTNQIDMYSDYETSELLPYFIVRGIRQCLENKALPTSEALPNNLNQYKNLMKAYRRKQSQRGQACDRLTFSPCYQHVNHMLTEEAFVGLLLDPDAFMNSLKHSGMSYHFIHMKTEKQRKRIVTLANKLRNYMLFPVLSQEQLTESTRLVNKLLAICEPSVRIV